jgi:outer membrane protein assembly factor BamB/tetratricopeptide (TPR) repeat protein
MALDTTESSARKLVEAAALSGRPIPLDVAAALIDGTPEEALAIGERLMEDGILAADGDGFVLGEAEEVSRQLNSVRTAYLYGELARAFAAAGYAERAPGMLGEYLLRAGDAAAAVPLIDAAAASATGADEVIDLVEAGVTAIEEQRVGSAAEEGRLRLQRAKYYQAAGWADRAADDLRVAIRLLEGDALVDALGFLAAVEDNRQEPQSAEVYASAGIAEATKIGEVTKAGSLLVLQARILNRIGFPVEADTSLAKGVEILEERGNRYQRFLATQNSARIALDRGNAVRAEPLFHRMFTTAEDAAGAAAKADAAAWLARAQFMHGHPDAGLESVATAIALAEPTGMGGPIFLAHMANAEGASRFAAHEEALQAADAMLEYVLRQLPDWENAARYLRARALLGLGRIDEAADEAEHAMALTPAGVNGWRWRLWIEALQLMVIAAAGSAWPQARAEDLTDELLQGQRLDVAAELMAVRAGVEEDVDLARQATALSLQLGIPTTAARAIEAGGLWSDPAGAAVASRIKETANHVPEQWMEGWVSQPTIATALAAPEVVDEQLAEAAAGLQADLDAALLAAGLADIDTPLSPAQRRQQGLVRRRPGRARRGALLLGAAAAVVILAIGGGAVAATVLTSGDNATPTTEAAQVTTTILAMEDTHITDQPEAFSKTWVTLGGNQARTGATVATGVRDAEGFYWRNEESQSQFQASPIVIGQNVVVGARDGQVYFMDLRNGEVARVTPPQGSIEITAAGATIGSSYMAYVPNEDGVLYAYDVQAAEEVGSFEIETCCSPAHDEERGLLYVGDTSGFLHALEAGDIGNEVWVRPVGDPEAAAPITTDIALAGSKLFYGVTDQLWQFDLDTLQATPCDTQNGVEFLTPVISDGRVYAANTDRFIHVLDAETCAETLDTFRVGELPLAAPAVAGNLLFQPHARGISTFVYGTQADVAWLVPMEGEVDASSTRQQWWAVPPQVNVGAIGSSPVVANGVVYIGSRNGYVYALEPRDHKLDIIWEWDARAQLVNSVAVIDRAVYVATTGGDVIAIAPVEAERLAR